MSAQTVSREAWLEARAAFLDREKAFTAERDALSAARRDLPRYEVDGTYVFEGREGQVPLKALFDGRSQLLVQHFMFGPDWDEGCPSCSFWLDNLDQVAIHLAHRDATYVSIARAPYGKLQAYWDRLGWKSPVYSSLNTPFNFDFNVSFTPEQLDAGDQVYNYRKGGFTGQEAPGIGVFQLEDGKVYQTYATYSRGLDMLNGAYHMMDLLPKGRDEADLPWTMAWLSRRDAYEG